MAPANQPEDPDRSKDTNDKDATPESNPFVNFRRSVDNIAASVFSDLAEVFPSLQKYVPPPNKSFFDEWAREAFRRFNDSYERSTNPERKRIERMSCYDEAEKESQNGQSQDLGRRWVDRRRPSDSSGDMPESTDRSNVDPVTFAWHFLGPGMGSLFDSVNLLHPVNGHWRPSTAYITWSTYSPLRLEEDTLTSQKDLQWRTAFEDLLRVQHGLPMTVLEQNARRTTETQESWLNKLARKGFVKDRGSYPFLLDLFGLPSSHPLFERAGLQQVDRPELQKEFFDAQQAFRDLPDDATPDEEAAARRAAAKIADDKPETELELYEKWIEELENWPRYRDKYDPTVLISPGFAALVEDDDDEEEEEEEEVDRQGEGSRDEDKRASSHYMKSTTSSRSFSSSSSSETEHSGRDILESTTTTERKVLPDGSVLVHTKLKKKYTDGTEWNDESTTLTGAGDAQQESKHEERRVDTVAKPRGEPRSRSEKQQGKIVEAAKEQQKKGGWFWSNR